jgi:hypothetical protein
MRVLWKEDYERIVHNRSYFGDFDRRPGLPGRAGMRYLGTGERTDFRSGAAEARKHYAR